MYSNFWHIHVCLGYGLYSALGGLANQSSPATLSFSFLSSPLGDIGAKLCGQSDHTLTLMLRCLYKNVFVFNLSLWRCFCFRLFCPCMYSCAGWPRSIKGIVPQSISYRLINLIFWIVMGCGIARFGWRGLKTTQTWKFWSQSFSPGTSRGIERTSRDGAMGPRGAAPWDVEGQYISDVEGRRHGTSKSYGAAPRGPRCAVPWGRRGQTLRPKV